MGCTASTPASAAAALKKTQAANPTTSLPSSTTPGGAGNGEANVIKTSKPSSLGGNQAGLMHDSSETSQNGENSQSPHQVKVVHVFYFIANLKGSSSSSTTNATGNSLSPSSSNINDNNNNNNNNTIAGTGLGNPSQLSLNTGGREIPLTSPKIVSTEDVKQQIRDGTAQKSNGLEAGVEKLTKIQGECIEHWPNDSLQILIRICPLSNWALASHTFSLIKRIPTSETIRIVACGDDSTVRTLFSILEASDIAYVPVAVLPLSSINQQVSQLYGWGSSAPQPLLGHNFASFLARSTVFAEFSSSPSKLDMWNVSLIGKDENVIMNTTFVESLTIESTTKANLDKSVSHVLSGSQILTNANSEALKSLVFQNIPSLGLWGQEEIHSKIDEPEAGDEILELIGLPYGFYSASSSSSPSLQSQKPLKIGQKLFYDVILRSTDDEKSFKIFADGQPLDFSTSSNKSSSTFPHRLVITKVGTFTVLQAPKGLNDLVNENRLSKPLIGTRFHDSSKGSFHLQSHDPFTKYDDFDLAEGSNPQTIVFFVNPTAGGNLAGSLTSLQCPTIRFNSMLRLHIYNILDTNDRSAGLNCLVSSQNVYAVACGGDGTARWLISLIEGLNISVPVGIIPFGTGNDLSRVLGWGGSAPSKLVGQCLEGLKALVDDFVAAETCDLDLWNVEVVLKGGGLGKVVMVKGTSEVETTPQGAEHSQTSSIHLHYEMINYFSIGADAEMVFEFEKNRKQSQTANKVEYARQGAIQTVIAPPPYCSAYTKHVIDGNGNVLGFDLSSCRILLFQNIFSYGGGQDLWGNRVKFVAPSTAVGRVSRGDSLAGPGEYSASPGPKRDRSDSGVVNDPAGIQSFGDGVLELMTLRSTHNVGFKIATGGLLSLGIKRITQSTSYKIEFLPENEFYIQVDGEAIKCTNAERVSLKRSNKSCALRRASVVVAPSRARRASLSFFNAAPASSLKDNEAPESNPAEVPNLIKRLRAEVDKAREERDLYKKQVEELEQKIASMLTPPPLVLRSDEEQKI